MKKLVAAFLPLVAAFALVACGKQSPDPAQTERASQTEEVSTPDVATVPEQDARTDEQAAASQSAESLGETEEAPAASTQGASAHPSVRTGSPSAGPPTSARFKEGTHYQRVVPAQPTSVGPGQVEVIEVFWYGCAHCFALDPAIESWRAKGKPSYVAFARIPAMWNDITRMHARLFYATELLGKADELHSAIFREIHVNNDHLDTVEKITRFFEQHGVSADEFKKAFSSFAVESKLQRADFLNRRYRVQSVPMFIVNGKYTTDVGSAGGEPQLFSLIGELAAHEHGD